jgi:arylsulfatase
VVLADDMGMSDLGCCGGEIRTPNLDRLAADGLRFTRIYNSDKCTPTRAALLTGVRDVVSLEGIRIRPECATAADLLGAAGYATAMVGKWHLAHKGDLSQSPNRRGFQRFYGTILGAVSYWAPASLRFNEENATADSEDPDFYYTDAISRHAAWMIEATPAEQPLFLYVAYTAPHWPLHAWPEDIERYRGRYAAGWDALRRERFERMKELGVIPADMELSPRDPEIPAWDDVENKEWEQRRMEVYAAQIDRMDQGIGRIVAALEKSGQLDNTVIIFLADNGACAEDIPQGVTVDELVNKLMIARANTRSGEPVHFGNDPERMPGPENTYQSYGTAWANLSNTPFRLYKHWIHEGGISTPLIVHWPKGIAEAGGIRHAPGYLPDIMATILDLTGTAYPASFEGRPIEALEGRSLVPVFARDGLQRPPMFWEHEGNAAVRIDRWKLVKRYPQPWELYDMEADRTELHDLAAAHPERVADMARQYDAWAARCGVIPREKIVALMRGQGVTRAFWEKDE